MTEQNLSEYKKRLDEQLTDVMPESWAGHGRMVIYNSDLISATDTDTALSHFTELLEKKDEPPEKVAKSLLKAVKKKQSEN